MTPSCHNCPIYVTCQKKHDPPKACVAPRVSFERNGYNVMARQEQAMRRDAIDFSGNWN